MNRKPEKYDVIRCPIFIDRIRKQTFSDELEFKGKYESGWVTYTRTEHPEPGVTVTRQIKEDMSRPDPSRGVANFLVIEAGYQGGQKGTMENRWEEWPAAWYVTVQRMDGDAIDENGETFRFTVNADCYNNSVDKADIELIGRLVNGFFWAVNSEVEDGR